MDESGTRTQERYTGPSALRIANLLPHRVSFERGWFWTTTAICHGGKSDGLAFRQRPDGNGLDVRCHTGSCGKGVVITELEALVGLPIWTAYEPVRDAVAEAPRSGHAVGQHHVGAQEIGSPHEPPDGPFCEPDARPRVDLDVRVRRVDELL